MKAITLALPALAILASAARASSAQTVPPRARPELGIEVGASAGLAGGTGSGLSLPLALRNIRGIGASPWQFDTRIAYTPRAASGDDQLLSVGVAAEFLRSFGGHSANASGVYLIGGPSLTLRAAALHAPTANVIGLNAGLGRRTALGQSAALRTDVVATHDFASYGDLALRAANRVTLRVAIFVVP